VTAVDELIAFVRACLDRVERLAREASPGPWKPNAEHDEVLAVDDITVADGFALSGNQLRATVEHIALHDPATVLADVAAKRRILDLHVLSVLDGDTYCALCHMDDGLIYGPGGACETVRALAQAYAGWDGWREEWRA